MAYTLANPVPPTRSFGEPLLYVQYEAVPGSGVLLPNLRVKLIEVFCGCNERPDSATFEVRLAGGGGVAPLTWAQGFGYVPTHSRIQVYADVDDGRVWLFDGHVLAKPLVFGGGLGEEVRMRLRAAGVLERWSRAATAWILGRFMPLVRGTGATQYVEGVPCWFNEDGKPNRSTVSESITIDGAAVDVPSFTYAGDPDAKYWTLGAAIRYVFARTQASAAGLWDGNVISATAASWNADPVDNADPTTLAATLLQTCPSSNVDVMNAVEAMLLLCSAGDLRMGTRRTTVAGACRSSLWLWKAGSGGPGAVSRTLKLEAAGTSTAGRTGADLFAHNDLVSGQIEEDASEAVGSVAAVGDVWQYEVTCELVPGWAPETNLDEVAPEDADAAKDLALLPGEEDPDDTWFQKYHKQGSAFAANKNVGRLWVLNEAGEYDDATFGRSNDLPDGPFQVYAPYDFETECSLTEAANWVARRRRFLPCLSKDDQGVSYGIYVELSFDSGTTWAKANTNIRCIEDQCAIYFEAGMLTEVTEPGGDVTLTNMWFALIEGTLRVRVTATVEADERVVESHAYSAAIGRMLANTSRFHGWSNTAGNSVLAAVAGSNTRDDSVACLGLAKRYLREHAVSRMACDPVIPWIDWRWQPGDLVTQIEGRGIGLGTTMDGYARYPEVMGVTFTASAATTRLILEESRVRVEGEA